MTVQSSLPRTGYLPATDPSRRIFHNGTYNARDAGDYPVTQERAWMKPRTLFRADALAYLDDEDLAEAARLGIRLVVDLRDPHERDFDIDIEIPGCRNVSKMLFEGQLATFPPENYPKLPELYQLLLTTHLPQIVDTLADIAAVLPQAVVVHCTAGKDRTGIITALLQSLAGVPLEVIIEDYTASEVPLAGGFTNRVEELYDRAGVDRRVIGPEPIASPGRYLGEALEGIMAEHGSIENFLLGHGLSAEPIRRIREALVVPAAER